MKIAVTGHRPPKIGGYDPDSLHRRLIRDALKREILALLITYDEHENEQWIDGDHSLITGMALGVDQDFAMIGIELGLTIHAYIPCRGQESRWPDASKHEYRAMLREIEGQGGTVTYVTDGPYTRDCMQRRNEAMVDACDHLIAVWDGSRGGTHNCVHYANNVDRYVPISVLRPATIWAQQEAATS